MIYFVTGGERSGKSSYAQQLALQLSNQPIYLATARKWDDDFEKRIARHQSERDERWTSIEEEKFISLVAAEKKVIVVDCVTLWLTNLFIDTKSNVELSLEQAKAELTKVFHQDCTWIIISNEIGMGVHAATEAGRKFVELQGWVNQYIAREANEVVFMVSGIPMIIKSKST